MALDAHAKRQLTFSGIYVLASLALLAVINGIWLKAPAPRPASYSEFLTVLDDGKVERVELRADEIVVELKTPPAGVKTDKAEVLIVQRLPGIDETPLLGELREQNVEYAGKIERTSFWESMAYGWFLPLLILFFLYSWMMRRVSMRGGPLSFGANKAKIYDASKQAKVTFSDVAGVDEAVAELVEVVDFLKSPEKYRALGARIPKGVLLIGPPGTGKTLLARAVAGEAEVPFFSLSGSEFVEMFVGVGAARMRDLFEQAKLRAPCIVFIDELDAIGKSRGGIGAMATHDEREQTLNQLLVEVDGFDGGTGVIIMAATNRPEVLDRALMRAGRFDRQVLVDRPDLRGREEILKVHARKAKLATETDLHPVAQRTPGMVGADLANVVNEAALSAARRGGSTIAQHDFEEAIDRLQLGLKKSGGIMNEADKRRVAFHEAGHALVALSVENADPVHRVTIIRRSIGALGATLQLPTEDRYLMTARELKDRICVMMGGRVAEELVFGDASTGAQNDLERATETARQMVCRFGMGENLGLRTFGRPVGLQYLEGFGASEERNYSEETARMIDGEVSAIVDRGHERAVDILRRRGKVLSRIAERLLEVETLERVELEAIVQSEPWTSGEETTGRGNGNVKRAAKPAA